MTWGGEDEQLYHEEKPKNGCRGLFFAAVFSSLVAIVVVIVILAIKC